MDNAKSDVHEHKLQKRDIRYDINIVQCAAACKLLQPRSGLVDAFLPRDAPTLDEPSCRELPRTPEDVCPFAKATPRKTNQRGKNRGRSMTLTDTPVKTALEAEAAKMNKPTNHKVARTLVPKKEVKSAKRQNL